jgi:hypothetical protein
MQIAQESRAQDWHWNSFVNGSGQTRPWRIPKHACNPPFAYRALQTEDRTGTMLPCNVIVQEKAERVVEVSAIDPVTSMQAIQDPRLESIAAEVLAKLKEVIDGL